MSRQQSPAIVSKVSSTSHEIHSSHGGRCHWFPVGYNFFKLEYVNEIICENETDALCLLRVRLK